MSACVKCEPFENVMDPLASLLLAMDVVLPSSQDDREDAVKGLLEGIEKSDFTNKLQTFLLALSKLSKPVLRNLCMICEEDMGPENPRQLCRKTYCNFGAVAPRKRSRKEMEVEAEADAVGVGEEGEEEPVQPNRYLKARRLFKEDESE